MAKAKKKAAKKKAAKKTAAKKTAKRSAPSRPKKKAARVAKASPRKTGETLLRAVTVAMIADGEIAASEREILLRLSREALFQGVDVVSVIESTIARCIAEGPDPILAEIGAKLQTDDERETALSSCLAIAATDGKVTPSEARMLRSLRVALGIPHARAKSIAGPLASLFG